MTYFGLTDWGLINWALVIIALVLVAGVAHCVLGELFKGRIMRCPDTGTITLVETECTIPGNGSPQIRVRACELWPRRADCKRGCLARYAETTGDFQMKVNALRPFE